MWWLRIYDTAGTPAIPLTALRGVAWTTKLPGGPIELTVEWTDEYDRRWLEMEKPLGRFCELTDWRGELLFAGLLVGHDLGLESSALTFAGWWEYLFDTIWGLDAASVVLPLYPETVLTQLLTEAAPLLSQSTAQLQHNASDIAGASLEFSIQRKRAGVALIDVLKVPDPDGWQWYAWVDVEKVLHYAPRKTAPDWLIDVGDLDPSRRFGLDTSDVWSSVVVDFTQPDGTAGRTAPLRDAGTWQRLGRDRTQQLALDTAWRYPDATAIEAGTLYLNEHARPRQLSSGLVLVGQFVRDTGYVLHPAYAIQAGDVIEVRGLPAPVDDDDGTLDSLRVLHVITTRASLGADGAVKIELSTDTPQRTLDYLLAHLAGRIDAAAAVG